MRESSKTDYWLMLDEEVDPDARLRREKKVRPQRQKQTEVDAQVRAILVEELHKEEDQFNMTYKAARHEQVWLSEALSPFFHDSLISDVLRMVRGGKEANVYCCQAHPALNLTPQPPSLPGKGAGGLGLLAAKIYRPLNRVMKDDSLYREGRVVLGDDGKGLLKSREMRAIRKKTRKGRELSVASWIEYEFQTMQMLYDAGANVPRSVTQVGNAILMEYIGDVSNPAPILYSITLNREEAIDLFEVLMRNVEIMLAHHRIHADLSAYNVLYWQGDVTIIDFPQVVDPILNPRGYALLARDIHRLCQYFNRFGLHADASRIATDLWGRYLRGELKASRQ